MSTHHVALLYESQAQALVVAMNHPVVLRSPKM